MPSHEPYSEQFYGAHEEGSERSAREIVPLVVEIVEPRSVVDVGCGTGAWLSVFTECGVSDVWGVDGEWVNRKMLRIPEERFLAWDLQTPLRIERSFDLVVSLEVAEHLGAEHAETFVNTLTDLGPVVLFSAAIPFQGGTHHVNEQWPEYWASLFQKRDYAVVDCLRRTVWRNENVDWYYAQNALIFSRTDHLKRLSRLAQHWEASENSPLSLVHPKRYVAAVDEMQRVLRAMQELGALVPPGEVFILVDHEAFRNAIGAGRQALPFLERDGQYWGPPADDTTALRELERLRRAGARFIAFAWPAFWWFEYYPEFNRHLRSRFPCLADNERLVVFDLRP